MFYFDKFYVKSQGYCNTLFEDFLTASGLYCFQKLTLESSRFDSMSTSHGLSSIVQKFIISNSTLSVVNNLTLSHCNIHISNKNTYDFYKSCCLTKSHKLHVHLSSFFTPFLLTWCTLAYVGPFLYPFKSEYYYCIIFVDS